MERDTKIKAALEAALLASGQPLSITGLAKMLEITEQRCQRELDKLIQEYDARESGLQIARVAGGYQLSTRPEFARYLEKLGASRRPHLSEQALETLAIIAYRQPITRIEIEDVRGVRSDGVISTLLELGLIRQVDRLDAPGKPIRYGTTREFLHFFGLKSLAELPRVD